MIHGAGRFSVDAALSKPNSPALAAERSRA
jgi:hypothetical protein